MNGKLETVEGLSVLRFERHLGHSIERVWRAITEPEDLGHWFPQGEPLHVAEREPPHLLAGTWHGEHLRFELRPDKEGCVLVFTHTFGEREKAARDGAGWDICLMRFEALLEGTPIAESISLESWPATHERYAASFGVDPQLGREAFAQHTGQS